jgi:thymidylate synthase
MFLGVPFNIASTALFTYLLAKTCDLKPGKMRVTFGDAHVYLNHISQVKEQLTRTPRKFPTLDIKVKKDKLEDYTLDDVEVTGYKPMKTIKAEMAV